MGWEAGGGRGLCTWMAIRPGGHWGNIHPGMHIVCVASAKARRAGRMSRRCSGVGRELVRAGSVRAMVGHVRFRYVRWNRTEPCLDRGGGCSCCACVCVRGQRRTAPGCWVRHGRAVALVAVCVGGSQARTTAFVSAMWDGAQTVVRCGVAVRARCVCGAVIWRLCGECQVLQGPARVQRRRTRGQLMVGIIRGVRARMAVLAVAALELAGSGVGVERAVRTAIGGSRRAFFQAALTKHH